MLVSTKGRYALRVLIDLAEHQSGDYVPLRAIAERQQISEKYLEAILKSLVRDKVLAGMRGKGGGYKLTREPAQYTVGSILKLTEGSLAPVACLDDNPNKCPRISSCKTLSMWENFYKMIEDYFEGITLEDLLHSQTPGNDYVI